MVLSIHNCHSTILKTYQESTRPREKGLTQILPAISLGCPFIPVYHTCIITTEMETGQTHQRKHIWQFSIVTTVEPNMTDYSITTISPFQAQTPHSQDAPFSTKSVTETDIPLRTSWQAAHHPGLKKEQESTYRLI